MAEITFIKNDGSSVQQSLTTTIFPDADVFGWTVEDKTFIGWSDSSSYSSNDTRYIPGKQILNELVTFYAIWKDNVQVIADESAQAIEYTQEITLDLNNNNAYTTVFAKQYDSGRYLRIHLTKDNIDYPIDATHNFYFRLRKPDGHGVINPAFVEIDPANIQTGANGTVCIQLTDQCLAVSGRGYADVVEYDMTGSILSTIPFILNIMSSPNLGNNITSNDEFKQLSQLMADTQALLLKAPVIDANTKHWLQYDEDSGTKIDTGVVAEGQDGASAGFGNITATIEQNVGTPSIIVETSGPNTAKNISFEFKNLKGEQGEKGDRGAPGLGGVSWVDNLDAKTEWHITNPSANPELIGAASGFNYSYEERKLNFITNISYESANPYISIAFASSSDNPSLSSAFLIDEWIQSDTTTSVVGLIFKAETTPASSFTFNNYFYGKRGERSGNVTLQAVSYASQSQFIQYDDETGLPTTLSISSDMKKQACTNIGAVVRNDIIKYDELKQIIGDYSYSNYTAADSTDNSSSDTSEGE